MNGAVYEPRDLTTHGGPTTDCEMEQSFPAPVLKFTSWSRRFQLYYRSEHLRNHFLELRHHKALLSLLQLNRASWKFLLGTLDCFHPATMVTYKTVMATGNAPRRRQQLASISRRSSSHADILGNTESCSSQCFPSTQEIGTSTEYMAW